jgi:hypothetical protein
MWSGDLSVALASGNGCGHFSASCNAAGIDSFSSMPRSCMVQPTLVLLGRLSPSQGHGSGRRTWIGMTHVGLRRPQVPSLVGESGTQVPKPM